MMTPYLKQLVRKLTADKKKLSVMVGLLAVLMLLWGRLLLKEVPRTAVAEPEPGQVADTSASPWASPNQASFEKVEVHLPQTLSRDLFSLDISGFTQLKNKNVVEVKTEKSPGDLSDEQLKASQVRQAATGLKLQTTMQGAVPLALINGQYVQVGEQIRGFELVRILPRQVVLRMNGIDIYLEM